MNEPLIERMNRRGRRWLSLVLLLVAGWFVIAYAPVIPYSPTCFERGDFWPVEGKLSERYVSRFTGMLHNFEVDYLYYNGNILLRFDDWLDFEDWVANASYKTVLSLADKDWGADEERLPDHVRKAAEEARDPKNGRIDADNCKLMHAVAIKGW